MAKKSIALLILLLSPLLFSVNFNASFQSNDLISSNILINAIAPSEAWTFTTGGSIATSPAFIDINSDGYLEIIIGSNDNYTYCINSTGHEEWKYLTGGNVVASPAVVDLDNDKEMDVLVASKDGFIYYLASDGTLIWEANIQVAISNDPIVVDLDQDGNLEVLVSDSVDTLYCLDNEGNSLWNASVSGYSGLEPVVVNFDTTPELEILLPGSGEIIYLNYQGIYQLSDPTYDIVSQKGLSVADLNRTGVYQVLFFDSSDDLVCANASDLSEHYFNTANVPDSNNIAVSIANIDSEPTLEIMIHGDYYSLHIFGGQGQLTKVESDGTKTWSNSGVFIGKTQPTIVDLDNNGTMDIIITEIYDLAEEIRCLDSNNNPVFDYYGETAQITNSPLAIDIDNDNVVELLCPGIDGKLYCLELTDVSESGKTPWSREKCSTFNTGHVDYDGDHLDDLTENYLGTNPELIDTDSDQLSDWREIYCYKTDPTDSDTDDDGLTDGDEISTYSTNPLDDDTDGDTIPDGEEVVAGSDGYVTDPNDTDTDGDGFDDAEEIAEGTDPTNSEDYPETETPTPTNTTTTTEGGSFIGGFISLGITCFVAFTVIVLVERRKKYYEK
ncbi:MAG: hypothetical protein EAX90_07085 [Candidatus Heimdallarchaeota archaeon]|nr:hypothetical protein [Candidatus Heimdallarchaeota archaeon]